jgi:hypothetical protein
LWSYQDYANSNVGYSVSSPVSFDTICVNSISTPKTFTLTGSFLTNSITTVGPLAGFVFSTSFDGTYTDSLLLNNQGASFSQNIYIKFTLLMQVSTMEMFLFHGGGVNPVTASVKAVAIDSRPLLSASITNVSCNNAKDGIIDLNP